MTETTVAVQKNQSSGPHPCDVSIGNLAKKKQWGLDAFRRIRRETFYKSAPLSIKHAFMCHNGHRGREDR